MLSVPAILQISATPMRKSNEASRLTRNVVRQGKLDPHGAAAAQEQPVGRGEQHFEEDEQVEQVAGQESAIQAHRPGN